MISNKVKIWKKGAINIDKNVRTIFISKAITSKSKIIFNPFTLYNDTSIK
jgi:hypothetical protein